MLDKGTPTLNFLQSLCIVIILALGTNTWAVPFYMLWRASPVVSSSVKGTVRFTGKRPSIETIKCPSDVSVCGKQQTLDRLVLGKDHGVGYTLVFIKNPPTGNTASMKKAVITQNACRFEPHMAIVAKGSSIAFVNQDPVLHNCHGYYFTYNGSAFERTTAFNIAQPIEGQRSEQELRKQGMIELECDAGHTWMSAWIWVSANPYCTITNPDGEYEIGNLPPPEPILL